MVSRIFENTKYTGKDGYPIIVSNESYGAAHERKQKEIPVKYWKRQPLWSGNWYATNAEEIWGGG